LGTAAPLARRSRRATRRAAVLRDRRRDRRPGLVGRRGAHGVPSRRRSCGRQAQIRAAPAPPRSRARARRRGSAAEVIISAAQNSEPAIAQFEYPKAKQEELIDYFKLTPAEHAEWNRERYGDEEERWQPPLKILIVCDRLLTGFDARFEQVVYLDKPLRDHNLLQAVARTNRPMPTMDKRTGVVVDYFGVLTDLDKALNFDESIREEALIYWDALKATVPSELARCLDLFSGVSREPTRENYLAALRRLQDPEVARKRSLP
jgi:type I restriction enzyme R subunit